MASIAEELALKMALEKTFEPEVRQIFNAMSADFRVTVANRGIPPLMADTFTPAWRAALNKHYSRAQNKFKGVALGRRQQDPDNQELLALALLTWRERNVGPHADLIMTTSRRNMLDALRQAREQLLDDGVAFPTNRELALTATAILRRKFNGRVSSITMSETQASSESTKFSEVEVEEGLTPTILGGAVASTSTKHWRTVGDGKVRPIHSAVNGQKKLLHQPFEVNGQLLRHPGDSSLGASVGNVANCRCSARYALAA